MLIVAKFWFMNTYPLLSNRFRNSRGALSISLIILSVSLLFKNVDSRERSSITFLESDFVVVVVLWYCDEILGYELEYSGCS